ncbi:hypothetical protein CTheo_6529 [Ceratobasidium theobromae]|uniref:Transmembrane protein n=1 Tax=Ceratobasidium theobromae TaxID=1582974 RepID=A0A5N5QED8_9AGAM|nr:hypothetical protein CTheo_6529 [Ceratobasidium theobromae]
MSNLSSHKESAQPLGPLPTYASSVTSPHYKMPYIPNDTVFRPVYDPHMPQEWLGQEEGKQSSRTPAGFTYSQSIDVAARRGPWWKFGFERGLSVGLFVFFAGAVVGFALSRTPLINFYKLLKLTTPGEGYWYLRPPFKASVIVHIVTCLPASFFSVFCFLPMTWARWPRFHGVLGYIVSVLLVVSCACGAVLGRRAQGGDLNVQSGVYMLASATAGAVIMGCITARRGAIDEHREWMLRAWFYNGTFVTTRVTALISAQVITAINSYYSLWKCVEVGYVLKSAGALAQAYPQCGTPSALQDPHSARVAVHASWHEGKLGRGSAIRASFGMSLWVAMILHFVGIELYLRMTMAESKRLREWSEQRANASAQAELPRRMP